MTVNKDRKFESPALDNDMYSESRVPSMYFKNSRIIILTYFHSDRIQYIQLFRHETNIYERLATFS